MASDCSLLFIKKGDPPADLRDADGFCYRLIRTVLSENYLHFGCKYNDFSWIMQDFDCFFEEMILNMISFLYFCTMFRKRHMTYWNNEALCSTCGWKREKFLRCTRKAITVRAYSVDWLLHLIHQGNSHDLQSEDVANQLHASNIKGLCGSWRAHDIIWQIKPVTHWLAKEEMRFLVLIVSLGMSEGLLR